MKIAIAQLNATVGDFNGNCLKILAVYEQAVARDAELVVTPELSLTGYPPQDLMFKSRFVPLNLEKLDQLEQAIGEVPLIVGFISTALEESGPGFQNSAALLQRGQRRQCIAKASLPTYDVFDEDRYFTPGGKFRPFVINGRKVGVTICEDIWRDKYLPRQLYTVDPAKELVAQGAEIIVNLSASPFYLGKPAVRAEMVSGLAAKYRVPFFYCNTVGANDQLIFDGHSLAANSRGEIVARLAGFREEIAVIDCGEGNRTPVPLEDDRDCELHDALVLGVRDYCRKCGFRSAVLGLSGGIDSAVVACLAVAALGAENVLGVTMPTQYSSRGSIQDSQTLAKNLGIKLLEIPIQQSFECVRDQFREIFAGLSEDTTEENIQPRLRAVTLMALSNKFGYLVLTTGNKSELAVGYCTLYGDMAGGLAVISDVPKTLVYSVARWINREREIIPRNTIEKPPSAELKPDQRDQDTLPPYDILDPILQLYVEEQQSVADIVAYGFEEQTVRWVVRRVDMNEYKREQAAPGLKVTSRAFGLGRRMPIAQRFVE